MLMARGTATVKKVDALTVVDVEYFVEEESEMVEEAVVAVVVVEEETEFKKMA